MFSRVGLRTSVRASSVPVEPIRVLDTHAASTARRISNAALDDTDAMLAASKRHDRQLLHDINARLANQSLQGPPIGVVKRSRVTTTGTRKPPLPPTGRSSTSVYSTVSTPHRSAASRYADDDDDVDMLPPTPITKSVIRASSVPPRLPVNHYTPVSTRTTSYNVSHVGPYTVTKTNLPLTTINGTLPVGHWTTYPDGVSYETTAVENNAATDIYGYVPTRVTNPPGLTPVADLAVRQAHRNLDRIERELKHSTPNGPTTTYPAYRYLPKETSYLEVNSPDLVTIRRSYYHPTPVVTASSPVSSVRIRHASLSPLRGSGGTSYHRVVQPYRAVSPVRPSELISLVSSPSLSARSPLVIEREIKTSVTPKFISDVDLYSLPSRTYRTSSLPPASPLFTVAGSGSSVAKSAKRHYDLDVAPIPQSSTNVRPQMSETRRKVRDVLCKVKKDPHYFD